MLVAQFTELSMQKAALDEKQKELVAQRDKIQKELSDFANIQEEAKVCFFHARFSKTCRNSEHQAKIDSAVEQRTNHQNAITHFKKKLDDENEKVKAAEMVAEQAQEEFTVRLLPLVQDRKNDISLGLDQEGRGVLRASTGQSSPGRG